MASPQSQHIPLESLQYIIDHVFLPPQLPQSAAESSNALHDGFLLKTLLRSLQNCRLYLDAEGRSVVQHLYSNIKELCSIRLENGTINEGNLKASLQRFLRTDGNWPIHIAAQNAGLLLSKTGEHIHATAFELSPPNSVVMSTVGRLRRAFPSAVVSIPADTFSNEDFTTVLAQTVAKMSQEVAEETKAKSKKAGMLHVEDRDTTNPTLVEGLLMSILSAVGCTVPVSPILKNTRDEILWSNTLLPWRRSPLWLFLRVSMQLVLSRSSNPMLYKIIMICFMSDILGLAQQGDIQSDLVHCMIAKISKRMRKVNCGNGAPWQRPVETVLFSALSLVRGRWNSIMQQSDDYRATECLKNIPTASDIEIGLPMLDNYIRRMRSQQRETSSPTYSLASVLIQHKPDTLPSVGMGPMDCHSTTCRLASIETWVENKLYAWLPSRLLCAETCASLHDFIREYHTAASNHYRGNPEALSVMLLTVLQLWVACDKSVTHLHPMLKEHDPGIPHQLLQSLILPFRDQMERLDTVEDYLVNRRRQIKYPSPIFDDFGSSTSIAARFFDKSPHHQSLLSRIQWDVSQEKQNKISELHRLKAEYTRLMGLYSSGSCEYDQVYDTDTEETSSVHRKGCVTCSYQDRAHRMSINVYEWPLPENSVAAKCTVFELSVPQEISGWRDATHFLNINILMSNHCRKERSTKSYTPDYCLSRYVERPGKRLSLVSEKKPHTATHYRSQRVSIATESGVCVNNGLSYRYYDNNQDLFVCHTTMTDRIPKMCTYQLPSSASCLQSFISRPAGNASGQSPNMVVSTQSVCPDHMKLEEYRALAALPTGYRIQWSNILVQLFAPSVDFKRIETHLVILQATRQAGPPCDGRSHRPGHVEPCDEVFASTFLQGLREGLKRTKENWESSTALATLISLACSLLTMSYSAPIQADCLQFLSACRVTAFGWTRHLLDRAHQAQTPDHRTEFFSKAFETAHLCASTFDVDQHRLEQLLKLPQEVALLLESSIVIQETSQVALTGSDCNQKISMQRWTRLLLKALCGLVEELTSNGDGLDQAVLGSWATYRPGKQWQSATAQGEWIVTETVQDVGTNVLVVHFNLLTAELLVNGLPVARLPERYTAHPMYKMLFGRAAIEVMPTNVRGMKFTAKRPHQGFEVSFGMRNCNESIVGTSDDIAVVAIRDNERFELLSQQLFDSQIPHHFAHNFIQWYRYTTNTIELRPIHDPWPKSDVTWTMTKKLTSWTMSKDDKLLLGVRNTAANILAGLLEPLEATLHIHLFVHRATTTLEIELPRLNVSFYLEEGGFKIQSREYRSMYMDELQRIDTLIGLRSKLVLRNDKGDRIVLIPNGSPQVNKDPNHVRVTIKHGASTKALPFGLDDCIGRVMDDGSIQSKLVLCRLHALTSYCLPDELTRKTGTEQALEILRLASVRSFESLTKENMETLRSIAYLTPSREFYPRYLRTMQQVEWNKELSFMSQPGDFYTSVQSLLEQAQSLAFFHPGDVEVIDISSHTNTDLLRRDLIRSSTFHVWDFGAEHYRTDLDGQYKGRSEPGDTKRTTDAFLMAKIIFVEQPDRQHHVKDGLASHLERLLRTSPRTIGPESDLLDSVVKYGAKWLGKPGPLLAEYWCQIHASIYRFSKFQKMVFLATMAFAKDADTQALQVLVAIVNSTAIGCLTVPGFKEFQLQEGHQLNYNQLRAMIGSASVSFEKSPDFHSPRRPGEKGANLSKRRKSEYNANRSRAADRFTRALVEQWPREVPWEPIDSGSDNFTKYIRIAKAMTEAKKVFRIWFENLEFYHYLEEVGSQLGRLEYQPLPDPVKQEVHLPSYNAESPSGLISIANLFRKQAPLLSTEKPISLKSLADVPAEEYPRHYRLSTLVKRLEDKADGIRDNEYAKDLRESLDCLQSRDTARTSETRETAKNTEGHQIARVVGDNLKRCQVHMSDCYEKLVRAIDNHRTGLEFDTISKTGVSTGQAAFKDLVAAGATCSASYQMPRPSPILFLQCLSRKRWSNLSAGWKQAIVTYGLAMSNLQRAERLGMLQSREADLIKELANPGHENWNPLDYPESLLVELESGITIRAVQEDIAVKMRDPPKGANSMMQLNMGEGKSSVIVPIVAANLANGNRLVRVIVAKPQSRQMLQMITSKLGGLCDRQVYHMPFSRSLILDHEQAHIIDKTYRKCMESGGILLVQPEQILSFRLMGIDCLVSDRMSIGQKLLSTQHFFDDFTRDIVDESDENFSVKFELIYTMGTQQPIELSPERWTLVQAVLEVFSRVSQRVQRALPQAIEVGNGRPGTFPRIRILREDAQKKVLRQVARELCETGLPDFPVARQPPAVKNAVHRYITRAELEERDIKSVESSHFWTETTMKHLLLLRGLIAGGILGFVFSHKRWRVNYGLDSSRQPRTRLALPFRAKDSPAPRSEYSHPDVVILLTHLSYYYGGLDDEELFLAMGHLVKSDEASIEYHRWVRDAPSLAPELRQLVSINLLDRYHCVEQVFPHFRQAKAAIDYFLAYVVFPKEMREFPQKLSASGWDIGQVKVHPTTGFSGTNDSKHLLPRAVKHLDLDEQRHTNALVLEYLLQPENKVELLSEPDHDVKSDAEHLLDLVTGMIPPVQVILDVGAQVLELSNLQVAQAWLNMLDDKKAHQAAVFVNDQDELSVLDRKGVVGPLQTSPFAQKLDLCVIFLDEAHTRGTDLRLPEHYRAAVTLGANLTKDRLVQACMRMRKLGQGQKVVFCIPREIQMKIIEVTVAQRSEQIQVKDVLEWAVYETGLDLSRSMPLWAMQGVRFVRQSAIWQQSRIADGINMTESQAESFLEDEAQGLEHRYRPRQQNDEASEIFQGREVNKDLQALYELCTRFNSLRFTTASLQEEQERELAPEVEQERQVERPPAAEPQKHSIHPDVRSLINTGMIKPGSVAFLPAFMTLAKTSAAAHLAPAQFPHDLLVTIDFAQTIKLTGGRQAASSHTDAFQRPVQWVLSTLAGGNTVRYLVIFSPYEVQELLPTIRKSKAVTLHLYVPRLNLAYQPLDRLRLYTIPQLPANWTLPPHLLIQLNLFAGQLYFRSFEEYTTACDFLGLSWKAVEEGQDLEPDGFINQPLNGDATTTGFRKSPVRFLKVHMMKNRRDCQSIEKTHVGRVLGGELLRREEFNESSP